MTSPTSGVRKSVSQFSGLQESRGRYWAEGSVRANTEPVAASMSRVGGQIASEILTSTEITSPI